MLFRNSIRLLMENFKNVYKILAYKFVIGLVASALCFVLTLHELNGIFNSEALQVLLSDVRDFFAAIINLDGERLSLIKDKIFTENGSLYGFAQMLLSKLSGIVLITIGCIFVYLLRRFAEMLCYFSTGAILNDKMSTYSQTPFFAAYVANLGKASVFAVVYVPVAFLFDLVTILVCLGLFSSVNIFAALFLSVTAIVVLQALKFTFTGFWMPAMTADGKRFRDVFKCETTTEKKLRVRVFSTYLVMVYTIIIVNVIAAICTFGSALLITVPASYLLFICLQYVGYYTFKGKKYFITYERIATNPDRGDREHFFDYIEDMKPVENVVVTEKRDDTNGGNEV